MKYSNKKLRWRSVYDALKRAAWKNGNVFPTHHNDLVEQCWWKIELRNERTECRRGR